MTKASCNKITNEGEAREGGEVKGQEERAGSGKHIYRKSMKEHGGEERRKAKEI